MDLKLKRLRKKLDKINANVKGDSLLTDTKTKKVEPVTKSNSVSSKQKQTANKATSKKGIYASAAAKNPLPKADKKVTNAKKSVMKDGTDSSITAAEKRIQEIKERMYKKVSAVEKEISSKTKDLHTKEKKLIIREGKVHDDELSEMKNQRLAKKKAQKKDVASKVSHLSDEELIAVTSKINLKKSAGSKLDLELDTIVEKEIASRAKKDEEFKKTVEIALSLEKDLNVKKAKKVLLPRKTDDDKSKTPAKKTKKSTANHKKMAWLTGSEYTSLTSLIEHESDEEYLKRKNSYKNWRNTYIVLGIAVVLAVMAIILINHMK